MITYHELRDVLKSIEGKSEHKMTENELQKIMEKVTIGDNQAIYYMDFITATLDKKVYLSEEKLWGAFRYFDVDSSNAISLDNLKQVMKRCGREVDEATLKKMIDDNDMSKDGIITFEEFKQMMMKEEPSFEEHEPSTK